MKRLLYAGLALWTAGGCGLRAQNACSVSLGNTTITPPPANPWYGSENCVEASGTITVNGNANLKIQGSTAIYFLPGFQFTATGGAKLTALIAPVSQTATPAITSSAGASSATVTITTATAGAAIRYTTNSTVPSETAGTVYSGPFTVAATTTINAIAYLSGKADSQIASATVTLESPVSTPVFSPAGGTYSTTRLRVRAGRSIMRMLRIISGFTGWRRTGLRRSLRSGERKGKSWERLGWFTTRI
jgi:hypothetical protein